MRAFTRFLLPLTFLLFPLTYPAEALSMSDDFARLRARMVEEQLVGRDIRDERVLSVMGEVGRHHFVDPEFRDFAYEDRPLPIGFGQTISQPYIVAFMTQAAQVSPQDKVLEIGTGSGYQAAVLARLAGDVFTVEILEPLAREAKKRLEGLGIRNVHVRHGDGFKGWPEEAPFDAILVTAAPEEIPPKLLEQLKTGGRLVIPVGSYFQELLLVEKTPHGLEKHRILPVRFVPMIRDGRMKPGEEP